MTTTLGTMTAKTETSRSDGLLPGGILVLPIVEFLAATLPEVEIEALTHQLTETTYRGLWAGAVKAFPKTRRRQHVIDRVQTREVQWQAFPGLKILLASARVLGEEHPGKQRLLYRTNIMFRDVKFSDVPKKGMLKINNRAVPQQPGNVFFEKLNFNDSVRVRCNCPDFRWRFNWECADENPSALFGPKAPPYSPPNPERYRGPANPSGLAGFCKHTMALGLSLHKSGAVLLK